MYHDHSQDEIKFSIKNDKDTEELPQTKAGQSAWKYPPELKTASRISQSATY